MTKLCKLVMKCENTHCIVYLPFEKNLLIEMRYSKRFEHGGKADTITLPLFT